MLGEIVGNFRIVAKLGRGGMGEVWLAEQLNIGTRVAIKVLLEPVSADSDEVQRFFNEARAVGRIQHAGIAKIFDVGMHAPSGRAYLVMELLEGETIGRRIARLGPLGFAELADLGRQVASVLGAVHGAGITHRDLKPDNIFIVPDRELPRGERAKVLDFGIAKLGGTLAGVSPRTTGMLGTPAYMAPEQWGDASVVDPRADIYSLGCVLFEMAAGRPPFVVSTVAEACAKHLYDIPPHIRSLVPGVAAELDRLIAAMLEKLPDRRPRSMDEVARALDAACRGIDSSAPTINTPAELPPAKSIAATTLPTRRQLGRLGVILVGVLALGGAATGGYLAATRHGSAAPIDSSSASALGSAAAVAAIAPLVTTPTPPTVAITPIVADAGIPDAAVKSTPVDKAATHRPSPARTPPAPAGSQRFVITPPAPGEPPEGTIDAAEVERRLRAHVAGYNACIQPHINLDSSITGRVVVTFKIGSDGRASEMSATGLTDEISGCVMGEIRRIIFPRAVGNPVKIIFPISFDSEHSLAPTNSGVAPVGAEP